MTLSDWLCDADRLADLGRRVAGAAVPVERLVLYRRTLHPEILGSAIAWSPRQPVEIFDRDHGLDLSAGFPGSALERAIGENIAASLGGDGIDASSERWTDPLRGRGLSTVLLAPLSRLSALAVGTRRPGGFLPADDSVINRLTREFAKGANSKSRVSQ